VNILITSDAFLEGEAIPTKYTCDGDDLSPDLRWSDIPPNTKSLALICEDPDAPSGTFTHWVLFGLPPTALNCRRAYLRRSDSPTAQSRARMILSASATEVRVRRPMTASIGITSGSTRSTLISSFKPGRVERMSSLQW
jgi:phosphatidylethanolamine-binding protein (PEBP) family uncharacterized protein